MAGNYLNKNMRKKKKGEKRKILYKGTNSLCQLGASARETLDIGYWYLIVHFFFSS